VTIYCAPEAVWDDANRYWGHVAGQPFVVNYEVSKVSLRIWFLWVEKKLLASAHRKAEVVAVQGLARRSTSWGKGTRFVLLSTFIYFTHVFFLIGDIKHENHRAAIPSRWGNPQPKNTFLILEVKQGSLLIRFLHLFLWRTFGGLAGSCPGLPRPQPCTTWAVVARVWLHPRRVLGTCTTMYWQIIKACNVFFCNEHPVRFVCSWFHTDMGVIACVQRGFRDHMHVLNWMWLQNLGKSFKADFAALKPAVSS
jgi:hypothetical protein